MRSVLICAALAVFASLAAAQNCGNAPASNPFATSVTGCSAVSTCQANLCTCLVGNSNTAFPACLAANTKICTSIATCYGAYFQCLTGSTPAYRLNSTDSCSAYGSAIYVAQLAAATSSLLNTTALYQACNYQTCTLANQTGNVATCQGNDSLLSIICNSVTLLGSNTQSPAPVSQTPVIVVTLRLSGASWASVLNDPTKKAAAITAITNDLAAFLGVDARFIVIISVSVGSLVVQFSVQDGSGKTAAQLSATVATAQTSSSWLSSTSSVYSTVGSDSIAVTSVATTTAAPGATLPPSTPTPVTPAPTSAAFGVAGAMFTAAAAVFAAFMQ